MVGIVIETLVADPRKCDVTEFRRAVRAASGAGFPSISMWALHAASFGIAETRAMLDDAGLTLGLAEVVTGWADGPKAAVDAIEQELDILDAFGTRMMLAISRNTAMDIPLAADGFAALCERAARRGIDVAIEFIPCRALPDLATAWRVVREAGAGNGGIVLDTMHWHYQPGGPDFDLLRSIPPAHIQYSQISDAAYATTPSNDDYINVALTDRSLPGDGVIDIPAVLKTFAEIGADPYIVMEIFSTALLAQGPEAKAKKVREAADRLFARAG